MRVVFLHGWSATHTDTYGGLPAWMSRQPGFRVADIHLGRYVSFVDTVTLDDLARGMDAALRAELGAAPAPFACVTHSTGGPLARLWMQSRYGSDPGRCPLKHLVMLAPANHGSALAQLGKSRVGRLRSLCAGIEPGAHVLDWLELGSEAAWQLNEAWLGTDWVAAGVYPFVLTGQSIDRALYDHLNAYTGEAGSDGVVRVASANLNYALLRLHQRGGVLAAGAAPRRAPRAALGVLPGVSHSGTRMGIMRSVSSAVADGQRVAPWVRRCLGVRSAEDYGALADELDNLTQQTQRAERVRHEDKFVGRRTWRTSRYAMAVFRMIDDRGEALGDYDLFMTGGPAYSPDELPRGFCVDRQRNGRSPGQLTYYLDADVMRRGLGQPSMEGRMGFRLVARPAEGAGDLAFYRALEWRSDAGAAAGILRPNETVMVEIRLERCVDAAVFRAPRSLAPSAIDASPAGHVVP